VQIAVDSLSPADQREFYEGSPVEAAPRGTDAQILFERKLTCSAIDGAMALGYRNEQPAPEGHWLAPYWAIGRKQCELEDGVLLAPGQSKTSEESPT